MTNPQGTQWESEIVNRANDAGLHADRYPKRGQGHEPDLWVGAGDSRRADELVPVLAWKRLVGKKSQGRRKPDGERDVVVLRYEDFLMMASLIDEHSPTTCRYEVQAKWKTNVNVTRVLSGLVNWMKENLLWQPR